MDAVDEDRYCDSAEFRLAHGPSTELWGDSGYDESLVGLEIVLDFPNGGRCLGTVQSVKESRHSDDSVFVVIWTCESSAEEFPSELSADDVVAWHFQGRERPSWLNEKKYDRDSPLFTAPCNAKMTNFALPPDANYCFPWVDDERSNRWWITLACLNDPQCASHYDPTCEMAYPLPIVLTIIVICKEFDPSVQLPMIVTNENQVVFELADKFARRLNEKGYRMGYQELENLEDIVDGILRHWKQVSAETCTENDWKDVYHQCKALVFTLSSEFENENDSWHYANDPEQVISVCAKLVETLASVLLKPPSGATKTLLSRDGALLQHLKAGNFIQFVEEEEFGEEHPQALKAWQDLTQSLEQGVAGN